MVPARQIMLTVFLIVTGAMATMTGATEQKVASANANSEVALFRKWTLSHCVFWAYQDAQTKKDAGATQNSFFENAKTSNELLTEMHDAVMNAIAGSKTEKKPILAACLDLYQSRSLSALAKKYGLGENEESSGSANANFKKYAISRCIGEAFKVDEVTRDAAASAESYRRAMGSVPEDIFARSDQITKEYLARDGYRLNTDAKPYFVDALLPKCIDMSQGPELEAILK